MKTPLLAMLGAATLFAAEFRPLFPGAEAASLNRGELAASTKSPRRGAAVFAGDTLLPSVGSGRGLRTEITFLNLSDRRVSFSVHFLNFDGTDLYLPLEENGPVRGGRIAMEANEMFVIRTEKSDVTVEGWGLIRTDAVEDCVGSFSKMLLAVDGSPDMQVTIPTVGKFDNKSVLAFDNVNGGVLFTVINAASRPTAIKVTVRAPNGDILATEQLTMASYKGASGTLAKLYPVTAGRRGTVTVEAGDFGAGVIGMQVTDLSISMVPPLSNPEWD